MTAPVFILATELIRGTPPGPVSKPWLPPWSRSLGTTSEWRARVDLACLASRSTDDPGEYHLGRVIDRRVGDGASLLFLLPTALELNIWQRTTLGEEVGAGAAMPGFRSITIRWIPRIPFSSIVSPAWSCGRWIARARAAERRAGPCRRRARRARHPRRLVPPDAVDLGASRPGPRRGGFRPTPAAVPSGGPRALPSEPLGWLLLPQCQWDIELCDFARVIFDDHRRSRPEAAGWELLSPPREHPAILAWLERRLLRLWQEKRARQASRIASARNDTPPARAGVWSGTDWVPVGEATIRPRAGCVARARDSSALAEVLGRVLPPSDQYLVKVTWHGYAPGTYTGPLALDLLLGACPAGRSC